MINFRLRKYIDLKNPHLGMHTAYEKILKVIKFHTNNSLVVIIIFIISSRQDFNIRDDDDADGIPIGNNDNGIFHEMYINMFDDGVHL